MDLSRRALLAQAALPGAARKDILLIAVDDLGCYGHPLVFGVLALESEPVDPRL